MGTKQWTCRVCGLAEDPADAETHRSASRKSWCYACTNRYARLHRIFALNGKSFGVRDMHRAHRHWKAV